MKTMMRKKHREVATAVMGVMMAVFCFAPIGKGRENTLASADGHFTAQTVGMEPAEVLEDTSLLQSFFESAMTHFSSTQNPYSAMITLDFQLAGSYNPFLPLTANMQNNYPVSYLTNFLCSSVCGNGQNSHLCVELATPYTYEENTWNYQDALGGYLTNDLDVAAQEWQITGACATAIYPFSSTLYADVMKVNGPIYVIALEPIPLGEDGLEMFVYMGGSAFYDTVTGGIIDV